jgi:nitrate reductase delta subunit
MIRGLRKPGGAPEAARVARLVRAGLALPAETVLSVTEIMCQVPGCPPIETLALIWDSDGVAYRLRVFGPLSDVKAEDIPPAWYLPALRYDGESDCGCC